MIIKEEVMEEKIKEWIDSADADEIARLAGEMFGGQCFPTFLKNDNSLSIPLCYDFTPDENYYGAFNGIDYPKGK